MCTLMPVESDVFFVSIVSLWIRGSVLVPIFHLPTAIILTSELSKSPNVGQFNRKTNVIPFRIFGVLSIGKKAPQVGHGTTATTGPRSASPFTENLPRLKQGS